MSAAANQATEVNNRKNMGLLKWIKSKKGQKVIIISAFSLIPLLLLFTFTYLPFGEMFQFSFYRMKYIGPRKFIGLNNYIQVFQRDDTLQALKLSLYYMGGH